MKSRKPWRTQAAQITKDLNNLKALINTHGIADINISTLEGNVHNLQNMIPAKIKNIEDADIKQGLYSDRIAKPCPAELPTFGGTTSEDFIVFEDGFKTAVTDNRVSKSDQLGKLRKALIGDAANRVPPEGITSVDVAWTILETAFGDPAAHLNFRLNTMRAIQPLRDKRTARMTRKSKTSRYQHKWEGTSTYCPLPQTSALPRERTCNLRGQTTCW